METIFSRMMNREIPVDIIYEDDFTFVIPDKFPSMPGQLLIISRKPTPYIFDLTDPELAALMQVTKRVSAALVKVTGKDRACLVVEGFEVPHVHIKVYPCDAPGVELHPKQEAAPADLTALAAKISEVLQQDN